jgi:myo-inositol-1(or 4)-monophosphatase
VTDRDNLLRTAVQATDRASQLVRERAAGNLTYKGERDYASEVDYAVERELREFLAAATPSIGLLGEEEGATGAVERRWVLDPVDGTVNFAHGLPLCGVSLALVEGNRPVLGVIDLPFLGGRYVATLGGGTYRNGQRIRTSETASLGEAVVSVGDYAVGEGARGRNRSRLAVTSQLAQQVLRVRMLGSAAVDLAWLAEGKTDAMITLSNKPWDTAAGVVIAREAGAVVVDVDGSDHTTESTATIAAAPDLLGEVLDLVRVAVAGVPA